MRKKLSLIYRSAICPVIVLCGCGGNDNSTSMNTNIGPVRGRGDVKLPGPTLRGNISDTLQNIISHHNITTISQNDYNDMYNLIKNNQSVDFSLQYTFHNKRKSNNFYHVLTKANNKVVGESFILFNKNANNVEGVTRSLSQNNNEYIGDIFYVSPLTKLWNNNKDQQLIENAIKNNSSTNNFNISFTLRKDNLNNYNFYNLNNGYLNRFYLKENQLHEIDRFDKLQMLLANLFVNFNIARGLTN